MNMSAIAESSRASQDKFELTKLLEILNANPPQCILEIGVHRGFSAQTWREAFPESTVIGIEKDVQHLEFDALNIIHGDSHSLDTFSKVEKYGPFDFILIDGDHSYEGTRQDWEMYTKLAAPWAVVAIHDTMRIGPEWKGNVETRQFFDEIRPHYQSINFWGGEGAPGTGIIFL